MNGKKMTVLLSPENIEHIETDHREGVLKIETNVKGPAGSTLTIVLPKTALIEAHSALQTVVSRETLLPPLRPVGGSRG